MKTYIVHFDIALLKWINSWSGNPVLDQVMLTLSEAWFWIAVFFIVSLFLIWKRQFKIVRKLCFIGCCIAVSDQISFEVIKPLVKRDRPCWVQDGIRMHEGHCGGSYGFTSNHAANAGVVVFLIWAFFGSRFGMLAAFFGFLIGLSRVYLGVHYPIDVGGGFLLGGLIGFFMFSIWNFLCKKLPPLKGTVLH